MRCRCGRGPSRTGVERFRTRRHASEGVHQVSPGSAGQLAIGTARLMASLRRRGIGRTGRIAPLMSPGDGLRPSPPPLLRSAIRPIGPIRHQGLSPACSPVSLQWLHRAWRGPRPMKRRCIVKGCTRQRALRVFQRFDSTHRVFVQARTCIGQPDTSCAALEQANFQVSFEFTDVAAERRQGHFETGRGRRQAAGLNGGNEHPDGVQVHAR